MIFEESAKGYKITIEVDISFIIILLTIDHSAQVRLFLEFRFQAGDY